MPGKNWIKIIFLISMYDPESPVIFSRNSYIKSKGFSFNDLKLKSFENQIGHVWKYKTQKFALQYQNHEIESKSYENILISVQKSEK